VGRRWIALDSGAPPPGRLDVVPKHVGSSGSPWRLSAVEAAQLQGDDPDGSAR
jgi:hypothetical protein